MVQASRMRLRTVMMATADPDSRTPAAYVKRVPFDDECVYARLHNNNWLDTVPPDRPVPGFREDPCASEDK
jgi:hypothetical protein